MNNMTTLQEIETAIAKLTPQEYKELLHWMDTRPHRIDRQQKADLDAERTDDLMNRAMPDDMEPELDARLDRLAKETGQTKSYYARQAIEEFLEDREDYLLGIASLEQQQSRIPLASLRKELDLER